MSFKPEIGIISSLKNDASNIDTVAAFGLHCAQVVSWNPALATMEIARTLRKRAADANVRLTAIWGGYGGPVQWNFRYGPATLGIVPPGFRWIRIKELCNWADFAAEAGAPALITHCGFLPENRTDAEFEPIVEAVRKIADHCKELGIGFWFETGQETPVALLRVIEATGCDNLGINLDPANLIMYGKGNPIDALDVFGRYVRCIHAKDGTPPTSGDYLGHEVRVGEGSTRYPEFIKKLLDGGFTGDLIIEREISGEQQAIDIRKTINYLQTLLPDVG